MTSEVINNGKNGKIHQQIHAAAMDAKKIGIAKDAKFNGGNSTYSYKSIEGVLAVASKCLTDNGVFVVAEFDKAEFHNVHSGVKTKFDKALSDANNNPLPNYVMFVSVYGRFRFVSKDDGSFVEVRTNGGAPINSADVARPVNIAQVMAWKYALIMILTAPGEGIDDETPENILPKTVDGDPDNQQTGDSKKSFKPKENKDNDEAFNKLNRDRFLDDKANILYSLKHDNFKYDTAKQGIQDKAIEFGCTEKQADDLIKAILIKVDKLVAKDERQQ